MPVLTLARLGRLLERHADPRLPLAHYRVLALVAAGDARASRLARRLEVGKPSITATVEALVAKGFVTATGSEEDRRTVTLTATPAGMAALHQATADMARVLAEVVDRCPDPGLVRAALAHLGAALDERATARDARAAR